MMSALFLECLVILDKNPRLSECVSKSVSVELVVSVCASAKINYSPLSVIFVIN